MTLLLFLLFIIPIALLVNSLVDSSGPVIRAVTQRRSDAAGSCLAEQHSGRGR